MPIREATFTVDLVDLGEHGYFTGFDDDYDFPTEMPYGWRCGPATQTSAVVAPTTDTGPEPGIGDHGERLLVQRWLAPQTPPVHPHISET
ncbi:hypothetical protein [Streptomyces sp. AM6-12]|uniref:hypothetical protein n=1 Tax=Streptomyces sp. AM6-12 TaxID=3345149 RepID=UPI003799CF23